MEKFAKPGEFCPNEACPDYGKLQNSQQQNLEKFGKIRKGVERYRCQTCRKTFTETFGTIFTASAPPSTRSWKRWPYWPKAAASAS